MEDSAPPKKQRPPRKKWGLAAIIVIFILAAGYAGVWWYVRLRVMEETARLARQNPYIEQIKVSGLRLSPIAPRFVLKDVKVFTVFSDTPVTIGAVKVFHHEMSQELPTRIHYSLASIQLKPQVLGGRAGSDARRLGYEEINGGLTLAWEMDTATRRLNLSALDVTVDRGWESSISLTLENLNPSLLLNPNPNWLMLLGYLQSLKIASAKFYYKDKGLVDRIIARLAGEKQNGKKETAQSLAGEMRAAAGTRSEPEVRAFMEAISRFCLPPHSLTVTVHPPEPVAVSRLLFSPDPATWIKTLGVEAVSP